MAGRSTGGPGQGPLRWAGGVARRAWQLAPMGLMGLVSWSVWLVRRLLSVRYQPMVNHYRTTTSVVVPAYREDPDVLERCLRTWYRERPDEIIVVPDVERRRGDRAAGALRPGRPADPGAALRAPGQAVGPRRRDPGRPLRRGRARRLRHRLAARAAGRRPDALRRPHGRRGRDPPERLPARLQHLAAGRGLAGQRALPGLPAGPEPGRGGGLPVGPDGRLPPGAAAAAAAQPGAGGLHGPRVRGRRRRPPDLADPQHRLQDRLPVERPGGLDVPQLAAGLLQAAGALEPQLLPLLPDLDRQGLAVAPAVHHPGHRPPGPADALLDGHRPGGGVVRPARAGAGGRAAGRRLGVLPAAPSAASPTSGSTRATCSSPRWWPWW